MAGVGVRLNPFFKKESLAADLVGFLYSTVITIAPMLILIAALVLMQSLSGFSTLEYAERALFSCTVLYIFIFSLLTTAPFNAVLSKYLSDVIYLEKYEEIRACYDFGKTLNVAFSSLLGIPFCLYEHFVSGVRLSMVFGGFCGYIGLVLVFYSMLYLSICKEYRRISLDYIIGMLTALLFTLIFCRWMQWNVAEGMLLALTIGFFIIAVLEDVLIRKYFSKTSNHFRPVLEYFRKYWQLIAANTLYTLGLYIHNFVFWTTNLRMTVANSFVCNQPYDLASCLAMLTNISATVIFISRVEMNFHTKYRDFSDAITGGRGSDIERTKQQMFRTLSSEMMTLVRIQFIISVILYFVCIIFLPEMGVSDTTMQIYPLLAVAYFILFVMYYAMIFLYYYNDLQGALLTSGVFFVITWSGSIVSTHLPVAWYGTGLLVGALAGWCVAYGRLQWIKKHLYEHIFCEGELLPRGKGKKPPDKVFDRKNMREEDGIS